VHPSPRLVKFLETVLYGERADAAAACARGVLRSLTAAYRALLWLSLMPYRVGLRKRQHLARPVISVGNLTVGGTGKSPTVQYLCRGLADIGCKPAILSYGYAGSLHGRFGIASDASGIRLTPDEAGDEPVMLAESLPGVPVLVGKDRARSGRVAIQDLGADILVLDDGFQVWNLHRDLDIVLINSTRPFDNGRTLPAGRLREPLTALKRANCVIATGRWKPKDAETMVETVRRSTSAPVFFGRFAPSAVVSLPERSEMPVEFMEGRKVFALSSIASPRSFEESLVESGAIILGRERLPDHHVYTPRDIARIGRDAMESGAEFIATTDKDAVKLDPAQLALPALLLRIRLNLEDENGFWDLVRRTVHEDGRRTC